MGSKDMKSPFSKVMKQKYRLRGKIKTRGMTAMMDGDINSHVNGVLKHKSPSKPKVKENQDVTCLKSMKFHTTQEVIGLRGIKSPGREIKSPLRDIKSPLRDIKSPLRDMKSPVRETKSPGNKVMKQKYRLRGKIKTRGMMALMDIKDVKSHVNQILKQKNSTKPKIKESNQEVLGSKEKKSIEQEVIGSKDRKNNVNQKVIGLKEIKLRINGENKDSRDMKSPVREVKSPCNKVTKQKYRLRGKIKTRGMMALMDVKDVKTHVNQVLKQKNLFKNRNNNLKIAKDLKLKDCNPGNIRSLIDEVVGQENNLKNEEEIKILKNIKGLNGVKRAKANIEIVIEQKKDFTEKELNIKRNDQGEVGVKDMTSEFDQIDVQENDEKEEKEPEIIVKDVTSEADKANVQEKDLKEEREPEIGVKVNTSQIEEVNVLKNDLKEEKESGVEESNLEVLCTKDKVFQVEEENMQKNEIEQKTEESILEDVDLNETKSQIQAVNEQKKEPELDNGTPEVMDVKDVESKNEAIKEQRDEKELEIEVNTHVDCKYINSEMDEINKKKDYLENRKCVELGENSQEMMVVNDSISNEEINEQKSDSKIEDLSEKEVKTPHEKLILSKDLLTVERELILKDYMQEVNDFSSPTEDLNELKTFEENDTKVSSTQEVINNQNNLLKTEKEQNMKETSQINGTNNSLEKEKESKVWKSPQINGYKNNLENGREIIIGSPHGLLGLNDIKLHLNKLAKQNNLMKKRRSLFKLDSSEIFDSAPPDEIDHSIDSSIDNPYIKGKKRKLEEAFNPHVKQKYTKKKEEIANPFLEVKKAEKTEEEYFQEMQSKMKSNLISPGKIKSFKNSLKSRRSLYKYNVGDMYEGPPNEVVPLAYKLTESPNKIVQRQLENKLNTNAKDL